MPEPLPLVRRSVIVVGLKDPFIQWVFNIRRAHYGEGQVSLDNIKKRASGRRNAYLLPPGRPAEPGGYVREHSEAIFENELGDWCLRTELWPPDRSWDVFSKWLGYEFHPLVYDAAPGDGIEPEEGA